MFMIGDILDPQRSQEAFKRNDKLVVFTPVRRDLPTNSNDLCSYWHDMKTLEGKARFGNITKLVNVYILLPHSNADPERIFSTVRKLSQIILLKWSRILYVHC